MESAPQNTAEEAWIGKLAACWRLGGPVAQAELGFRVHLKRLVLEGVGEKQMCSVQGSYQKSCSIGYNIHQYLPRQEEKGELTQRFLTGSMMMDRPLEHQTVFVVVGLFARLPSLPETVQQESHSYCPHLRRR